MSPTHECTDKCEHRIGLIDMGAWDIMKARAERAERIVEAVKALCIEGTRYSVGGDRVSQFITKIINAIADSH